MSLCKNNLTMKILTKPEAIITSSLLILIAAIALVLMLSGCSYERVEGNYDLVTENRSAQSFDEIISSGDLRVFIYPDSVASVEVKAESNIQPYVYTIFDGSTLRIGFRNGYNIRENYPVEVILHTPAARILRLQGSGRMESKGFETANVVLDVSGSGIMSCDYVSETMDAEISGSGRIELSGEARITQFNISGSGTIRALDLDQTKCTSYISGSGDVYTKVSEYLKARISGSGCVYYDGNPEIDTSITGSGKVKKY